MVGLSKIVTLLVAMMAVLCLAGIASPAFAQSYGGKGIPSTSNVGMGKGIPQTANVGANANVGMGKGMGKGGALGSNIGSVGLGADMSPAYGSPTLGTMASDAGYGGDMGQFSDANIGTKGIPSVSNVGMGKGMPSTANVGANANMGLGKGMGKGGGGYGGGYGASDMGFGGGY